MIKKCSDFSLLSWRSVSLFCQINHLYCRRLDFGFLPFIFSAYSSGCYSVSVLVIPLYLIMFMFVRIGVDSSSLMIPRGVTLSSWWWFLRWGAIFFCLFFAAFVLLLAELFPCRCLSYSLCSWLFVYCFCCCFSEFVFVVFDFLFLFYYELTVDFSPLHFFGSNWKLLVLTSSFKRLMHWRRSFTMAL